MLGHSLSSLCPLFPFYRLCSLPLSPALMYMDSLSLVAFSLCACLWLHWHSVPRPSVLVTKSQEVTRGKGWEHDAQSALLYLLCSGPPPPPPPSPPPTLAFLSSLTLSFRDSALLSRCSFAALTHTLTREEGKVRRAPHTAFMYKREWSSSRCAPADGLSLSLRPSCAPQSPVAPDNR